MHDTSLAAAPRSWQLGLSPHCRTAQPSLPAPGSHVLRGGSLLLTLMNEILQREGGPSYAPAFLHAARSHGPCHSSAAGSVPWVQPCHNPSQLPCGKEASEHFCSPCAGCLTGLQDCSTARVILKEPRTPASAQGEAAGAL